MGCCGSLVAHLAARQVTGLIVELSIAPEDD
jgi:hypothetical protein